MFGGGFFVSNEPEEVVMSPGTGIPLSDRFRTVPGASFNQFTPKRQGNRLEAGFRGRMTVNHGGNHRWVRKPFRKPQNELSELPDISQSAKLAMVNNLEARLQQIKMQFRLGGPTGRTPPTFPGNRLPRNRNDGRLLGANHKQASNLKSRLGGGFKNKVSANYGRSAAQTKIERILRDPRPTANLKPRTGLPKPKGSFFGTPKTRDDLDAELDSYMSQSKTIMKSRLDRELELMHAARSRLQGSKSGGNTTPEVPSCSGLPVSPFAANLAADGNDDQKMDTTQ